MPVEFNEISEKAFGGTELMARRISNSIDPELLKEVQIIPSRVRELDETKIRILYLHDLPLDPESKHLANEGWRRFHKIVFVSFWQRDWYMRVYNIPYSRTVVIHNAIEPIEFDKDFKKPEDNINLIYHTTPHRGLELLVPVFKKLAEKYDDIHLDVYSSFEIYGWKERDEPYKELFEDIKNNERMTYHGYQSNDKVREALKNAHIFAFPSVWMETSCLSLIEAMSAQCVCVHSDLGALPETSANWTFMYNYHETPNIHANIFYESLKGTIEMVSKKDEGLELKLQGTKSYSDLFYDWNLKAVQWNALVRSLLNLPREIEKPEAVFRYKVGGP